MKTFKSSLLTILLALVFLVVSCTNENSITNSTNNNALDKPTNITEVNSPSTNDFTDWFNELSSHYHMPPGMFAYVFSMQGVTSSMCFFAYLIGITAENIDDIIPLNNIRSNETNIYEFRDNYLTKSGKGKSYVASYYILSEYGIRNNIVQKYYKEHVKLLNTSVRVALDLQHGKNSENVLINKQFSDELKAMLEVYRSSNNSKEITPVLDYLEKDLEIYYNKPKYEIATDFLKG